jgi:hypothetical protein
MIDLPFSEDEQLNTDLILSLNPTTKHLHLQRTDSSLTTLPSAPRVHLDPPSILTHLNHTLLTPELNLLSPHPWLASTPSHSHISPLHHNLARGRQPLVTDSPSLHLLWHHYIETTYKVFEAFFSEFFSVQRSTEFGAEATINE